jgi:hypothetical protein
MLYQSEHARSFYTMRTILNWLCIKSYVNLMHNVKVVSHFLLFCKGVKCVSHSEEGTWYQGFGT